MEVVSGISLNTTEEINVELFGLFNEDLLEITEGTKASAKLAVTYQIAGETKSREYTAVLNFHNRNALTWDDDRKIAWFITAKDPEILTFAKRAANWMQEVKNPEIGNGGVKTFSGSPNYIWFKGLNQRAFCDV